MALSERTMKILASGEGVTTEFKQSFGDNIVDVIVAFANKKGGTLLIGVAEGKDENGQQIGIIKGIAGTDENRLKIQSAANSIHEKVEIAIDYERDEKGFGIYIVTVFEGRRKPYCTPKGRYLIRGDGQNTILTPASLAEFYKSPDESPSLEVSWVNEEEEDLDVLIVPPTDRTETQDGMICKLRELLPEAEQISLVEKFAATINYRLYSEEKASERYGGQAQPVDCVRELRDYVSSMESRCMELQDNFSRTRWSRLLQTRRIKPRFALTNSGSVPAVDPVAHVYPDEDVIFFDDMTAFYAAQQIPSELPKRIVRIISIAAGEQLKEQAGPKTPWGEATAMFPHLTMDILRPIAFMGEDWRLPLSTAHLYEANLNLNSPKYCLYDDKKNRMVLGYKGNLRHGATAYLTPYSTFLYSKLATGRSIALKYVCYANNLRQPSAAVLNIECK